MAPAAPLGAIVFDMDGTLVHTREAAWQVFAEINAEHGLGIDTPAAFFSLFEQDLSKGLAQVCADQAQAAEVFESFLAALRRSYAPAFVPGMAHVVRTLAAQTTLVLISGNAMSVVRRVLESNGVATCFAHVFTADVEPSKAVSLQQVLADPGYLRPRRCAPDYVENGAPAAVSAGDVAVVTDTVGDVREARSLGMRAVGVSWGMHSQAALREAGAEMVALWPEELLAELAAPGVVCEGCTCAVPAQVAPAQAPPARTRGSGAWERARAAAVLRRDGRGPALATRSAEPAATADLQEAIRAIVAGVDGRLSAGDEPGGRDSTLGAMYQQN